MVSETNAGVCLGDINIHQHHWGMNDNFINKKKLLVVTIMWVSVYLYTIWV